MDSSYRIIISTSSLNIEDWTDLYGFIDSIYSNRSNDYKQKALKRLKDTKKQVSYAAESNSDVNHLFGQELTYDILKQLKKHTCYSILYQKKDNTEEFTGLAPFVLFLHRFLQKTATSDQSLVSLGIDTDQMPDQHKATDFYFKCKAFFTLYEGVKPVLGEKILYLISKNKYQNGDFADKGKEESDFQKDISRRFLPLLQITEDNYHSIFTATGFNTSEKSKDYLYVNESLNKIKDDFKNRILKTEESKLDLIVNYEDSLFGQWLINGYFYSYEPNELRNFSLDDIKGIMQTLQIYKNSIFELVQNIIFHGGKSGLFYCVFDKKDNISIYYQNNLPDFKNDDSKVNRFMRVGIYDYQETDFVDSFIKREWKTLAKNNGDPYSDISLRDFFDPKSISTIGISRLDMRYAAHLGIKSFVKTVFKHNGYFSVESNETSISYCKKRLITNLNNTDSIFQPIPIENFAPGTHYEIILPVLPTLFLSAPTIQRDTILNFRRTLQKQLKSDKPIKTLDLDYNRIVSISNSKTKELQITAIKAIGNDIIKSAGDNTDEIALNLCGKDYDHKLVFKILAYMQLTADKRFKRIILINGTDNFVSDFCELINPLLYDSNDGEIPVWSNDSAIILMSDTLHGQIICGKTKGELYSLNQEFHKYYCNNFTEKSKLTFNLADKKSDSSLNKILNGFILPYDILVKLKDGTTLFEKYSLDLLKRRIISNDLGFLVNHENTYIGNKIIVKNYYEADLMFQNSFFAERFAFLISKNICKLRNGDNKEDDKELVLIGYQQYSEYLLKAIKRIVNDKTVHIAMATANDETTKEKAKDENVKNETVCNEITNDEKRIVDIDLSFNFDIDGNNSELRDRILTTPEQFQFATIVPIGATLSTNDKIIALFKLWYRQNDPAKRESTKLDFLFNHCVIIVRDTISFECTALEKEQQWKEIQLDQHLIKTGFRNADEIHFTIQIANTTDDNSNKNNWLKRLNNKVSFPKNWVEEKYVNFTENSSINSQNLMGFPRADTCDYDPQKELERLYEFRNDIYKGHFDAFKSHHKYFFDTETFVRRGNITFFNWLSQKVKRNLIFNLNNLNIIITPNAETESDLVCAVNDQIFDGNALIVYLDVKNWRNNIVHKLSFLKHIDNESVSFHYVDHILLTGETYHRTKSYLYSIIDDQDNNTEQDKTKQDNQEEDNQNHNFKIFDSIITVINRLPYTKGKEIKNDVNNHLFTFINLYYPTSRLDGKECELCKLQRYYYDLSKKTVLDSCKQVIQKNVDKLICKSRRELEQCRNNRDIQHINRIFLRLVITHELYYRISQIAWDRDRANKSFDSTQKDIYEELDAIYCKLCNREYPGDKDTKSNINDCIDKWFRLKFTEGHRDQRDLLEYHNMKLETDKKISFLKVISSPPLSKYIIIRQYAHSKLLTVLYEIIKDNNENENNENENIYDDLKIIKSILKSLSFLKSNALVRKDVIVEVWKILGKARKHLVEDLKRINNCIGNCTTIIHSFEEKQQALLRTGNFIPKLENQIKEANEYLDYLEREKKHLKDLITKDEIIKDFSRDFQFFIKNAIVEDDAKATFLGELIRQGEEIHSFDNIKISKTKLYLKEDHSNQHDKNILFECFQNEKKYPTVSFGKLRKEYIDFLVWLFYDNTTIIRKTLANFSMELKKDSAFNLLFKKYIKDKKEFKLKTIKEFKVCVFDIEKNLYKKINHEYYYSSFKPYLYNGDGFDYIRKLIYLTYAKLKLEDITRDHHIIGIEADTNALLEIFAKIMGADAAFLTVTISGEKNPYAFSKFNCDWSNDNWILDNFYTYQIHSYKNIHYPFITKYNLQDTKQTPICGEGKVLDMHSLGIMVIDDNNILNNEKDNKRKPIEASITFLYNPYNELICDKTLFRIHTQESGRLLLLLKNEIYSYIIQYLKKEKILDIWLEKDRSYRKFEKIYANSSHTFNSVYDEMEEFENFDKKTIHQVFKTWYSLSNQTISFIYSNIEKNRFIERDTKYCITLDNVFVIDRNNTFGKTFNDKFISLLSSILDGRWNSGLLDNEKNFITINNQDINDFELEETLSNIRIPIKKQLLQTIIVQCINNSLSTSSKHGHRVEEEIKKVNITISPSCIIIEDQYIKDIYTNEQKKNRANRFTKKKKLIKQMKCDAYSSTTLTTLQGVINFMTEQNIKCNCEYGFNHNNNFVVTIKLTEK